MCSTVHCTVCSYLNFMGTAQLYLYKDLCTCLSIFLRNSNRHQSAAKGRFNKLPPKVDTRARIHVAPRAVHVAIGLSEWGSVARGAEAEEVVAVAELVVVRVDVAEERRVSRCPLAPKVARA